MSEAAHIPQLRFPEFGGGWNEKKLGSIATFYNSRRVPLTESDRIKGAYPYYGASGVIDYVEDYIFDGEYILLGEDGANIVLRNSRLVFLAKGKFWVNNHAHIFQAKESNYFLCEALERINYSKYNTGTAQPKLNSDVVKKIKLNLPTQPEQTKIAEFLTVVDNKIEQLSKKQKLLGGYKKGLMEKIFSQAIRFKADDGSEFPDWEEKKLGDVLDYEQPTNYIVESTEYDDSFDTPVLTAGKSFILGYTNETHSIFHKLPVIIFDDFTTANKYVDFPFKVKSSAMKILKSKDNFINTKLVFEFIQMLHFPIENHKRYWISEYQDLKIPFPSFIEQTKIANFLSSIDSKIEQVSKQFNESKQFKKALLQQMFV